MIGATSPNVSGLCKSWTLDSGLDTGLDCGLDYGLIFGLDSGLSSASVTTISIPHSCIAVCCLLTLGSGTARYRGQTILHGKSQYRPVDLSVKSIYYGYTPTLVCMLQFLLRNDNYILGELDLYVISPLGDMLILVIMLSIGL